MQDGAHVLVSRSTKWHQSPDYYYYYYTTIYSFFNSRYRQATVWLPLTRSGIIITARKSLVTRKEWHNHSNKVIAAVLIIIII